MPSTSNTILAKPNFNETTVLSFSEHFKFLAQDVCLYCIGCLIDWSIGCPGGGCERAQPMIHYCGLSWPNLELESGGQEFGIYQDDWKLYPCIHKFL